MWPHGLKSARLSYYLEPRTDSDEASNGYVLAGVVRRCFGFGEALQVGFKRGGGGVHGVDEGAAFFRPRRRVSRPMESVWPRR